MGTQPWLALVQASAAAKPVPVGPLAFPLPIVPTGASPAQLHLTVAAAAVAVLAPLLASPASAATGLALASAMGDAPKVVAAVPALAEMLSVAPGLPRDVPASASETVSTLSVALKRALELPVPDTNTAATAALALADVFGGFAPRESAWALCLHQSLRARGALEAALARAAGAQSRLPLWISIA